MWKALRTKAICQNTSGEIFGKARGTSSNGRALDSHSRGTGIDTPVLQLCFFEIPTIRNVISFISKLKSFLSAKIGILLMGQTGIDPVAMRTYIIS